MNVPRYLYSGAYAVGLCAALPYLAWKGLRQKKYFGSIGKRLRMPSIRGYDPIGPRVWIHAVSVGEVKIAKAVAAALQRAGHGCVPFLTTTTKTGTALARANPEPFVDVLPYPLDFRFSVRRAFDEIKPDLLILVELELWPNLLFEARARRVPVLLANGRITRKSHRGYSKVRWLVRPALEALLHGCVREETDKQRLADLGLPVERITVTGNIKYDIPRPDVDPQALRGLLGLDAEQTVVLAGCTMRGEEELVAGVYKRLLRRFPALRLVLAPRHPERFKEAEKVVERNGLECVRRSACPPPAGSGMPVVLLDTIGELASFYATADVALVGGSLIPGHGGHNPLEPAVFGIPVLFGPFMENFADIALRLVEDNGAVQLAGPQQLYQALEALLSDAPARAAMGASARQVCEANRGAVGKTVGILAEFLKAARDTTDANGAAHVQ